MGLFGNQDQAQNSLIANLEINKVDKEGGIYIPPTEDPKIAGVIWNDSGVPKISTGS